MTDNSENPRKEQIAGVLSIVTSAIPTLGGPVSAILNGYVTKRKFDRMADVINQLADDLKDYKDDASEQFVATEDFEDLLDDTLRKVASERSEEKRTVFKNLLRVAIKECDANYDEHLRILRILEQMQPDHILLLKALSQDPNNSTADRFSSSPREILQRRLPFDTRHLTDLVEQLEDLRVIRLLSSFNTKMTSSGARDLKSSVTPLGARLMKYISETP